MLIVQIEPAHVTRGGDWYYRTHSPGSALAAHDDVHVVDLTNVHRKRDLLLDRADLVVLNMVCDPDLLPAITRRAARGAPTVYEVNDDVACMQPWNPVSGFFANPDHQILFRMLVRACAGVQFCTPELARIYGRLAACSAIFPNQIARPPDPPRVRKSSDDRVVVGWGGSIGHLQDIAQIAPTLIEWVSRRSDVVLHLMCAEKIWEVFGALAASKKRHFPTGDIEQYHAFVAGLDIGIAPIENTGFNRCRSDVKFLEYGIHAVAPVVRSLPPYAATVRHRQTGMLFETTAELVRCLDQLVDHPDLRLTMAQAAQTYVASERSEAAHSEQRLAFYRSLPTASGSSDPAASRRSSAEAFGALAKLEGANAEGRHLTLEPTRYEVLVHDALVIGQLHARKQDALACLREASQLEPNAYQPHLFGASMSTRPIEWLQEALKRNPISLKARIALAEQLAMFGQIQPTVASLLAAAEAYPAWDVPYQKLSEFMGKWNKPDEAKHFAEAAAALRQPFLDLVDP